METFAYQRSLHQLVEEEVSCIVCFEKMKDPKLLNCFHVFCAICIERGMEKNGKIKCPTCRKTTKIPNANPMLLQTCFFVNRICDLLEKYEKKMKTNDVKTEQRVSEICSNCQTMMNIDSNQKQEDATNNNDADSSMALLQTNASTSGAGATKNGIAAAESMPTISSKNDGLLRVFERRKTSVPSKKVASQKAIAQRRHTDSDLRGMAMQQDLAKRHQAIPGRNEEVLEQCLFNLHAYNLQLNKRTYDLGDTITFCLELRCKNCPCRLDARTQDYKAMLCTASNNAKSCLFANITIENEVICFTCKAKYSGEFVIIVEVNGKAIDVGYWKIVVKSSWKAEICSARNNLIMV